MWSSNPNIKVMPQGAAPSSPPLSPGSSRKGSPWHGPAIPPHLHGQFSPPPMPSITVLRPPGLHGPSFSFTRAIDPDQLSPQSRSTSSETSSDSEDDPGPSMQPSPSPSRSPSPSSSSSPPPLSTRPVERIVTNPNLIVEEILSDDDGNGNDDDDGENARVPLPVMYPDTIEYADEASERSRSRTGPRRRHHREIDESMMYNLGQLNCSDSSSESEDIEEAEHRELLKRQREERRRKRMTSGSIGKRTFAERSDSDVENDPRHSKRFFGADQLGSSPSARRIFQRVADHRRRSVQVSDPMQMPPPRIDEIEEPDSNNEEILVDESTWSRELPYYECVMMDIDSS